MRTCDTWTIIPGTGNKKVYNREIIEIGVKAGFIVVHILHTSKAHNAEPVIMGVFSPS